MGVWKIVEVFISWTWGEMTVFPQRTFLNYKVSLLEDELLISCLLITFWIYCYCSLVSGILWETSNLSRLLSFCDFPNPRTLNFNLNTSLTELYIKTWYCKKSPKKNHGHFNVCLVYEMISVSTYIFLFSLTCKE